MNVYLEVLGRFHPMVLHLPVGTLIALALLELLARARGEGLTRPVRGALVGLSTLTCVAAAISGWVLAESPDYGSSQLIFNHRWLGVGLAVVSLLLALAHRLEAGRAYGALLVLSVGLLFPVGHLGATMTHGKDFLFEPLREKPERQPRSVPQPVQPAPEDPPELTQGTEQAEPPATTGGATPEPRETSGALSFTNTIAPILAGKCTSCHGDEKQKGGLALHTVAAIEEFAAGSSLLTPDPPFEPELVYRITLPLEDPDRMPPEGKPQLEEAETALLLAWVAAGSPFEGAFEAGAAPTPESAQETEQAPPQDEPASEAQEGAATTPPEPPDATALAALREAFVHVQALGDEDAGLWIDFAAVARDTDDQRAATLLEPLLAHVVELGLARSGAAARSLELCARMPRLERLDLRASAVDDAALAALAEHPSLRELTLAQNELSRASVPVLLSMPALEQVFLWNSGFDAEALGELRAARPELALDDGTHADAATLEVEPEVRFKKPGEDPAEAVPTQGAAAAPVASNTECPVSGSAVDPRYGALYEGKLIGFCCANCPKQFWADPATFAAKLD